MKIALAQTNPTVGDIEGNMQTIIANIDKAKKQGASLVVFSELSLTGYPPRDLIFRHDFIVSCQNAIDEIKKATHGIGALIGTILPIENMERVRNAAVLLYNGELLDETYKTLLPSYDVFEEDRFFVPAQSIKCIEFEDTKLGVTICEDIWNQGNRSKQKGYVKNVLSDLTDADIFINLSASPYNYEKMADRLDIFEDIGKEYNTPLVYVNQVGGNDELVFDGSSMVTNKNGTIDMTLKSFEEDFAIYDTEKSYEEQVIKEDLSWLYESLVLGIKDYFRKTGHKAAVLGLSGGIDSSLSACLLKDALGSENVVGISIPSRYSSEHSKDDARVLAENLGIEYRTIAIEDMFKSFISAMNENNEPIGDLAEENIQARLRGNIWMFVSNREGSLAIANGNKSEFAVGYSTLYGDMCGALAVIGDVLKTKVYELCRYINRDGEIIPNNVLVKPPSAELRPDQKDEDSLPPYEVLDNVIRLYIEEQESVEDIIKDVGDAELVYKILNMIDRAEFKRRQAAPVIKVSKKAFGIGRRLPIAQRFVWK